MKLPSVCFALFLISVSAHAQIAQTSQRIVGNQISGEMQIDAQSRVVIETRTLTFQAPEGGAVYTVDFTARHPVQQPVPSSGAVDVVVTQHPSEDVTPEMTLRADGESVAVVTRLHSRRSVVATITLADLDRLANAGMVTDRTFNTDLEFGPGQLTMLRETADRWLGRVR